MRDRISAAAPHELLPALRFLTGTNTAPTHAHGELTGVFVARDSTGRVCGATRAEIMPGSIAVLLPPRAESPSDAECLARVACDWLRTSGVNVCQAYASAAHVPGIPLLEQQGFRRVTRAILLRCELHSHRDTPNPSDVLDGRFYQPELRTAFTQTWLATQENSLDCPELEHSRTLAERAAGFELPDGHSVRHFLAEANGQPVGVSVTELGADGVLGISYLGVVPAARGNGVGWKLLGKVLHEGSLLASVAEVCVDARNHPALRLYQRYGFVESASHEVFIAKLQELPASG